MATVIVSIILFGAFVLAGYNTYKKYKNKGSCCCCSGCPSETECNKLKVKSES
ncbi:FeoB-associated Cys-rich membrane protein [Acetivibrio clariflavus]|uniref:Virus attachment protein p12 family protein n=1 Tax=Acetivibrio clariflavus (strain DSM 19732 / NBRC 101661 / EBR45) TaxID=720554 RepID=G8LU93_ACECE|nr:FeoB-associated Cys-rich membrane protein [Acetivibrio clariflavus]AEV69525.1 hypothetical protein Clocl_2987 [Acetivibrio clariflavus DSM 19732]